MLFFLAIIAIFVVTSVYFFFRAESLQNQLIQIRRDLSAVRKESKVLVDSMAMIAKKNEDFATFRLQKIREVQSEESAVYRHLFPLVSNYSAIFSECAKANGMLHRVAKKCFDGYEVGSYTKFKAFVNEQNVEVKRMWGNNNLNGFMSLIEALLLAQEKKAVAEPLKRKERQL